MAPTAAEWRRASACAREEEWGGSGIHSRERRGAGTRVGMEQEGGALLPCMVATPWTRAHYVEHVAGDERGMVGGALS